MSEITIVIKNRQYANVVLTSLLATGFEFIGKSYPHDGCALHLETPKASAPPMPDPHGD